MRSVGRRESSYSTKARAIPKVLALPRLSVTRGVPPAGHGSRGIGSATVGRMTNSVSFDRIAHRYDETRSLDTRRHLASFLMPWLVSGPVLDIGVGTGQVASG